MQDDPQASREANLELSREDGREGRWLSYAELGRVRGIGRESAKKLALREGWRRIPGNDGATRVLVPTEWLKPAREPSRDRDRESSRDTAAFETALTAIEAAHASEVAALRGQVDAAEQGRIAMQELADRAMAQLADAGARAERDEALIRNLEADLRTQDAATADAEERAREAKGAARIALGTVETLRREEEARKARGRWARLRAAWRGE